MQNQNNPFETATVYFDNTTRGVITNSQGYFSIKYSDAIQSPLIISFLGYEKQIIENYRDKTNITILLKESKEALGEVIVNANDGLTRQQKLRLFRREFLGTSKFGSSCQILNEEDIILRYDKKNRVLSGHSKLPLKIQNNALQYLLTYDLSAFRLKFIPIGTAENNFDTQAVGFVGNSYYQDFQVFNSKKAIKNRAKAYQGSRLEFIRALYAQEIEERGYQIFAGSNKIEPQFYFNYFQMETKDNSAIKQLSISQSLNILYKRWEKSSIKLLVPSIFIDYYGNYTNVTKVRFTGAMGEQRIGELLPFDYGLNTD